MTVWGQVGKNSLCIPDTYFPVAFKKYSVRIQFMGRNAGACKFLRKRKVMFWFHFILLLLKPVIKK